MIMTRGRLTQTHNLLFRSTAKLHYQFSLDSIPTSHAANILHCAVACIVLVDIHRPCTQTSAVLFGLSEKANGVRVLTYLGLGALILLAEKTGGDGRVLLQSTFHIRLQGVQIDLDILELLPDNTKRSGFDARDHILLGDVVIVIEYVRSVESHFGDMGDGGIVWHDGEGMKREKSVVVFGLCELD